MKFEVVINLIIAIAALNARRAIDHPNLPVARVRGDRRA
jgi:hypothetical protein